MVYAVKLVSVYGSPRRCGGQGDILSGRYLLSNFWFHFSFLSTIRSILVDVFAYGFLQQHFIQLKFSHFLSNLTFPRGLFCKCDEYPFQSCSGSYILSSQTVHCFELSLLCTCILEMEVILTLGESHFKRQIPLYSADTAILTRAAQL